MKCCHSFGEIVNRIFKLLLRRNGFFAQLSRVEFAAKQIYLEVILTHIRVCLYTILYEIGLNAERKLREWFDIERLLPSRTVCRFEARHIKGLAVDDETVVVCRTRWLRSWIRWWRVRRGAGVTQVMRSFRLYEHPSSTILLYLLSTFFPSQPFSSTVFASFLFSLPSFRLSFTFLLFYFLALLYCPSFILSPFRHIPCLTTKGYGVWLALLQLQYLIVSNNCVCPLKLQVLSPRVRTARASRDCP